MGLLLESNIALEHGKLFAENKPLPIDYVLDIFQGKTLFAPMLWLEGRGMRDIQPGEKIPPGTIMTGWIDEETFQEYLMTDGVDERFMKDWMLFIRTPTYAEYKEIQWKD